MKKSNDIRVRVSLFYVQNRRILLAKHSKNGKEYYLLPGGGVDHGESMPEALLRELKEEGGFSAEGLRLQAVCESLHPHGERHIIHVVFRAERLIGIPHSTGLDKRVVGIDYMSLDDFFTAPFYPDIKDYLLQAAETPVAPLYRQIKWIK
jgi:ADP-ribose pyrophosphatase YjhB (NUDIX family)